MHPGDEGECRPRGLGPRGPRHVGEGRERCRLSRLLRKGASEQGPRGPWRLVSGGGDCWRSTDPGKPVKQWSSRQLVTPRRAGPQTALVSSGGQSGSAPRDDHVGEPPPGSHREDLDTGPQPRAPCGTQWGEWSYPAVLPEATAPYVGSAADSHPLATRSTLRPRTLALPSEAWAAAFYKLPGDSSPSQSSWPPAVRQRFGPLCARWPFTVFVHRHQSLRVRRVPSGHHRLTFTSWGSAASGGARRHLTGRYHQLPPGHRAWWLQSSP